VWSTSRAFCAEPLLMAKTKVREGKTARGVLPGVRGQQAEVEARRGKDLGIRCGASGLS